MKTKSLFLTLAFLLSVSISMWGGSILTDEFVPGDLNADVKLSDGEYKLFCEAESNVITSSEYIGISSEAEYVGQIGYDATNELIFLNNKNILATKNTGGRAKQVFITWGSTGNTNKKSQVLVYAGTTAFVGTENKTGVGKKATLISTITFTDDGDPDVTIDIPSGYSHVAILGASTPSYFEYISIDWEEITYYGISVSPSLTHGTIALGKTSAEEGERVSMTITPDLGYELRSYSYNETIVNLTEAEYTTEPKTVSFVMPDEDVTVSATFSLIPDRDLSDFYFYASSAAMAADDFTDEISITSGEATVIYFTTDPIYNATTLSFDIESSSNATIASHTYNKLSGEGTVTLNGYAVGETTLTITAAQTAEFDEAIGEVTIVVEPKHVVLVTEYEGKYFAATTTMTGSDLEAQEVIVANGNVYYDPDATYKLADITWNLETIVVDEEELLTLSNSSDEYLRTLTSTAFSWRDTYYAWVLEGGKLKSANDKAIIFSNSDGLFKSLSFFTSGEGFAESVYPVDLSSVSSAKEYSRGLTSGNYATLCLPYAVSPTFLEGVDVYNITAKHMSGGTLTAIDVEEEEGVLVAGKPYIIQATASVLNVLYGAATVLAPVSATGLVGNLSADPVEVPVGCYVISKNQIRKVVYAKTASTGQYKAYIDLSTVPEAGSGAPAPGRRTLYAEGYNTPTSVDEITAKPTSINWDEPVYNTLGQQVGKGTTGVLIQNGQKFLIQ